MNYTEVFAERMQEARKKANMTQSKLASLTGISPAMISAYENPEGGKKSNPSLERAKKIADVLKVPLDWLCGADLADHTDTKEMTTEIILRSIAYLLSDTSLKYHAPPEEVSDLNPCLEIESENLKEFIEKYLMILDVKATGVATPEMIETLTENLIGKYRELDPLDFLTGFY